MKLIKSMSIFIVASVSEAERCIQPHRSGSSLRSQRRRFDGTALGQLVDRVVKQRGFGVLFTSSSLKRKELKKLFSALWSDEPGNLRYRIVILFSMILLFNGFAWIWAWGVLKNQAFLLGSAVLAYTLGLRHAVDMDHLAAIDNVTRKLIHEGKQPITTGLYFSLGHSTIVFLGSLLIYLVASHFMHPLAASLQNTVSYLFTGISALFLLCIAGMNFNIFLSVFKLLKRVRKGSFFQEKSIAQLLQKRGFLSQHFRFLFKLMNHSRHMYPLGFLFGLSFDTASEIGLLGITAKEAMQGVSLEILLVFPTLFAAGMTLIDTTDGILMFGAYDFAFLNPVRKLYYNVFITFFSVVIAFVIGCVEVFDLLTQLFTLHGRFWEGAHALNAQSNLLGCGILLVFLSIWIVSTVIYRKRERRFHHE